MSTDGNDLPSAEYLRRALQKLEAGLERCKAEPEDDQLLGGLIQRFEFTYELAHKTLRRFLRAISPAPDTINQLTFPDLIREGYRLGFLNSSFDRWKIFREQRARTSHTHDESIVEPLLEILPEFLDEVRNLCQRLERLEIEGPPSGEKFDGLKAQPKP